MTILHYFLGFPPYRTGGLTKFAMDLMKDQAEDGNQIIGLWPGEIKKCGGNPIFRNNKRIKKIRNVELVNPLPVPLDEGIKEIDAFTKSCDENLYMEFLKHIHPDVIHIHTLMGIHKEFFSAANKLGIRMIFTTHDYFGICPKVTMYNNNGCCENDNNCYDCIQCNCSALSLKKIIILQSRIYRKLKDSFVVKKIRKQHRTKFYNTEQLSKIPKIEGNPNEQALNYKKLREYYVGCLEKIDCIHFNSTVSEKIYRRYINPKSSQVISITHQGIKKRIIKRKEEDILRITYLAPTKAYKGFYDLKQALDELWMDGKRNFILNVFSNVKEPSKYMHVRDNGYKYEELEQIFSQTDIVIVPSVWYETFGFTALEAVSFCIPVIISNHVGAGDVVGEYGYIYEAGNIENLKDMIEKCDNYVVKKMRDKIKSNLNLKTWEEFRKEMYKMYLTR